MSNNLWQTKLPSIDSNSGRWKLILLTGLFTFIFANVFEPFGIYSSSEASEVEVFIIINVALISAMAVLILTHFAARNLLNIQSFTYFTILIWFLMESTLIGALWTILDLATEEMSDTFMIIWLVNIRDCILLIGLPYFASLFYLNYREKHSTVEILLEEINKGKVDHDSLVTFKETSGNEKLSIILRDILYIQSSDNYVTIFYKEQEVVKSHLLRNSIKNLEPELRPYNLIRCHRSYMINPINVASKKKPTQGFDLRLKHFPEITVPISKSYTSEFDKILS